MNAQHSPLHPKALGPKDLWAGRRIVIIRTATRAVERATITRGIYTDSRGNERFDILWDDAPQRPIGLVLSDHGIKPYSIGWHDSNFVLDESDFGEEFPAYNEGFSNTALTAWSDQVEAEVRELTRHRRHRYNY